MGQENIRIETQLLHSSSSAEEMAGAVAPPIYQSTAFAHKSAESLEAVFAGRQAGFVYSRINNPTIDLFERHLAALEGGLAAVACASGMAAIHVSALALASEGDEIVLGSSIFGGTYSLFDRTLRRCGIRTRFVESTNVDAYRQALNDRTKMIFVETVGNPKLDVPNIASIARIAREKGVAFVVDNTATSPVLVRPRTLGANLVVHSLSKFINGHGNAIGGVVVDCGNFDWGSSRYVHLKPFQERLGRFAFIAYLRSLLFRDVGCCLSPFNAFLISMGLESLAVRMERHCSNACELARRLSADSRMESVRYPGLDSHPDHATARVQFGGRYGALITLRLGTKERSFKFINGLKRAHILANLGDARTLVIHPASTFCRDAGEEQRAAMGVTEDLVRFSIGLENVEDIWNDIDESLKKL